VAPSVGLPVDLSVDPSVYVLSERTASTLHAKRSTHTTHAHRANNTPHHTSTRQQYGLKDTQPAR